MNRTLRAAGLAFVLATLAAAPGAHAQEHPGGGGPPPTTPPQAAVPPIAFQERILPNGLKLYTALDRSTPNVSVQVWYGVGSKNDPRGRSGFAHLFEHLMFKATRDLPPESFDRLTEDVGGLNNASTFDDFTNYYEVRSEEHT